MSASAKILVVLQGTISTCTLINQPIQVKNWVIHGIALETMVEKTVQEEMQY